MAGGYAQAIAVGRATALSAAQEMVHAKHGTDNDDDTTDNDKNTTAKPRQNGASDWALGAYGSTFVLAPSFCLRLGAEDSLLLEAAIRHEGLAVLLQSELSGRRTLTPRPSVYSQLPPLSLTPPSKLSLTLSHRGQARAHSLCLGLRRGGGARPHRARAPRVDRRERRRQLAELRSHVYGAAQARSSKHFTVRMQSVHASDSCLCTSAPRLHHLLTACSPAPCSRAFGAILHMTEMQLRYFPSNSSITDMSISLAGVELHVESTVLTTAQRAFVSASVTLRRLLSAPGHA